MDLRSLSLFHKDGPSLSPQICNLSHNLLGCGLGKLGFARVEDRRLSDFGASKVKLGYRSSVVEVRALGKKNHGNGSNEPIPEEGGSKGSNSGSNKCDITDWRNFRANLVRQHQTQLLDIDDPLHDRVSHETTKPLGLKWAHSLSVPETGCVLVATEKLDGVPNFERTVVLLLRAGSKHPHEGPFGVVINRPLYKKMKHMKPTNLDLATTFADCSLYSGGPLEASMFLLNTKENPQVPDFEQVIPGLCFGARNNLDEAAALVKKGTLRPRDFRFFVGYAGWQQDQLKDEIESDYWYVAACSSNLLRGSSAGLWEEILQLMGGHYSEISKKPKQDI